MFTVSGYPPKRLVTASRLTTCRYVTELGIGLFLNSAAPYALGVQEVSVILYGVMAPA